MDTLLQARAIAASKGEVFDLGAFLTPARLNEYLGVNLDSLVRDEDASLENGLSSDNPLSLSQSQSNSQTQIPGQNQTQTQIEEKKRKYNIAGLANLHWTQRKKQLRLMEEARLEQEALSLLNTGAEDGDGKDGGTPGGTPVPGNIGTPGPSTVFPLLVGKGKDPESEKASIISSASYWYVLLCSVLISSLYSLSFRQCTRVDLAHPPLFAYIPLPFQRKALSSGHVEILGLAH